MIKNHRAGATEFEISSGSDVTFQEFVLDVLDHQKASPNKNVAIVSITHMVLMLIAMNMIALHDNDNTTAILTI